MKICMLYHHQERRENLKTFSHCVILLLVLWFIILQNVWSHFKRKAIKCILSGLWLMLAADIYCCPQTVALGLSMSGLSWAECVRHVWMVQDSWQQEGGRQSQTSNQHRHPWKLQMYVFLFFIYKEYTKCNYYMLR